jgi:hypothetical protein
MSAVVIYSGDILSALDGISWYSISVEVVQIAFYYKGRV